MTPYIQGELAANAGQPFTANPFPKPAVPQTGENYPGDWAHWMAGWRTQTSRAGGDVTAVQQALTAFGKGAA